MTDEILSQIHQLEGRIAACEVMHRYLVDFLTVLAGPEDRVSQAELIERSVMSNLQHIARQVSPESDEVWGAMGDSLRRIFAQVRAHAEYAAVLSAPPAGK